MGSAYPFGHEMRAVAIGQLLCAFVTQGIFVVLGHWNRSIVIGSSFGMILAITNFYFMCIFVHKAVAKAENKDVAGGQRLISLSYFARLAGLLTALVLLGKTGLCNIIVLALPLVFTKPILTVYRAFLGRNGRKT